MTQDLGFDLTNGFYGVCPPKVEPWPGDFGTCWGLGGLIKEIRGAFGFGWRFACWVVSTSGHLWMKGPSPVLQRSSRAFEAFEVAFEVTSKLKGGILPVLSDIGVGC